MLPLLAPILAQLVTLNVGDRTEARYVVADDKHFEGATRPLAGLNFGWRRSAITLTYTPSVTVTPLEREPRNVLIFQGASLSGSYHWRHTTVTLSEGVGYGRITFRVQALADPGANTAPTPATGGTTATPATGGTTATPALGGTTPTPAPGGATPGGTPPAMNPQTTKQLFSNQVVHYGSSTTTLALAHSVSRSVAVGASASYTVAGGVAESQHDYPLVEGAFVGGFVSHRLILSRRDDFTSLFSTQYGVSSTEGVPLSGNRALVVAANEIWSHKLDPLTVTRLGAGVAGSRFSQDSGLIGYSVYPTFLAGISHVDRLAGGILTVGATANAAPYLDPLRATVDPRLTVGSTAAWSRDRFSMGLGVGAAISLARDNQQGAVNSVGASLGAAYRLGAGFSVDGGVSAGWQTFQGTTIIPPSWTAFLGVTWGAQVPLNGH